MTVVRKQERERIVEAITARQNLIVYGATGMGKSHLISAVLKESHDRNVLYAPVCTSLKRMLMGLLQSSYTHSHLRTQNTLGLKKMFFEILKSKRPYLVIDHIGNITSRYCSFVQSLAQYTSLLIVARSLYLSDMKGLAIVTVRFDTLKISPLSKNESYLLLDQLLGLLKIGLSDSIEFKRKVHLFTQGNPMAMKQICLYARNEKYHVRGETNFKLLNLDRKIDEITQKGKLI